MCTDELQRAIHSPMKSMMSRPSQYLPTGAPKKVSPLGGGTAPKAADSPPVSELESPKLKMAGKAQGEDEAEVGSGRWEPSTTKAARREMW